MPRFTEIPYQYADASNWKANSSVFVAGVFSQSQLEIIDKKLDSGEFFIPTQVGLTALQPTLESFPSDADHVWHQLATGDFTVHSELPEDVTPVCTADELATRFAGVQWDVAKEYERLGLDNCE